MDIELRIIKEEEIPQAAHVLIEAFGSVGEEWAKEIAEARLREFYPLSTIYGAYFDGELTGIAVTKIDYIKDHREVYIDILAVLPKMQGKGIGKLLLAKTEDFAKENNIPIIWLQASDKLQSYELYMKNGFNRTSWVALYKEVE